MQKTLAISFLILALFVGFVLLKAKIAYEATISSPKSDQAIMDFAPNQQQVTHIQPETSSLSFINADLVSTQVADFVSLKNPTSQNINILPAAIEATPSPSPSPSPISTTKPVAALVSSTPAPTSKVAGPSPTALPAKTAVASIPTPPGSLSGDKIFDLVNSYRLSKNLPALQKDDRSCQLAASRAPEIMGEVRSGTMHKGLADRQLPYWNNENIAYYNTEAETVKWWVSDTIHRKQIEGNFKFSCVSCYKNACAEELTNFSPK